MLLCISVVIVWVAVLVVAMPTGVKNVANMQSKISERTNFEKELMDWEKERSVQTIVGNNSENENNKEEVPDVLNDVIYHLSSNGSISVDVLLAALDDNDSK